MSDTTILERRAAFIDAVERELDRAYAKHGSEPWSRHEFYAVLLEEVEEVWDEIKHDGPPEKIEREIVQVAAMCLRYIEIGNRWRKDGRP